MVKRGYLPKATFYNKIIALKADFSPGQLLIIKKSILQISLNNRCLFKKFQLKGDISQCKDVFLRRCLPEDLRRYLMSPKDSFP